jgi:hypothetical protein
MAKHPPSVTSCFESKFKRERIDESAIHAFLKRNIKPGILTIMEENPE